MTDVIKIAQEKRAKKLAQIEELMGEVEELEEFISFGKSLTGDPGEKEPEASSNDARNDESGKDAEEKSASFAAE